MLLNQDGGLGSLQIVGIREVGEAISEFPIAELSSWMGS